MGMWWGSGKRTYRAVNHNKHAIEMHKANHPQTLHETESVWAIDPASACDGHELERLWMSPDCRHFSKAKGGQPVSPKIRTLPRVGITWVKKAKPNQLFMENVEEFQEWGPLERRWNPKKQKHEWFPIEARKGEYFQKFLRDLKRHGYAVDYRVMNAADYGAPTERHRFILVARRDGIPIAWPKKTHGPGTGKPYRTMRDCIEWAVPTKSIFGRKKPHAEATQRRLAAGLVRFVLEPHQKAQMDLLAPLESHDDLQLDFLTKFFGTSTGASLDQPCPTVTAGGQHLGLVQAWIAKHYGGVVGHGLDRPLGTITTKDHHSVCDVATGDGDVERVVSWLTKYYGTATHGSSIDKPCPTITTKARMGLAQAVVNIRTMQIVDVRMRMCTPRELARAMGFPDSFILTGTATEQVARIGNAVPPHLAAAVVAANDNHREWRAAA